MSAKNQLPYVKQNLSETVMLKAIVLEMREEMASMKKLMVKLVHKADANDKPIPVKLYGVNAIKEFLNVGRNEVYRLIRTGKLPAIKIKGAGGWKVRGTDLMNYIEQKRLNEDAAFPHAARG